MWPNNNIIIIIVSKKYNNNNIKTDTEITSGKLQCLSMYAQNDSVISGQ